MRQSLHLPFLMVCQLLLLSGLFIQVGVAAEPAVISLLRAGQLPEPMDLHGSAVVGKRLYVFGGKTATAWNNKAWSGEIRSDATIASWREETPLPEYRTHITDLTQVVNNRLYIVGGLMADGPSLGTTNIRRTLDVLWTTIKPDGTLAEWKRAAVFPANSTFNGATVATDTGLYLFGGRIATEVTDTVTLSAFDRTGEPGDWRPAGKMPVKLCYQGAAFMDGVFYIWGGRRSQSRTDMNDKVFSSTYRPDGTLGAWAEIASMPVAVGRAGFLGFNDCLVTVGGLMSDEVSTNDTWFTMIGADRKAGQWETVKSDLQSRMYHSVAIDKDRNAAFITGGRVGETASKSRAKDTIDAIQAFALPPPASKPMQITSKAGGVGASSNLPVFLPAAEAIPIAVQKKTPALVFFFSPQVPECVRAWESVVNTPGFARLTRGHILTTLDSTADGAKKMHEKGVFKVPSLVLLRPDGSHAYTLTVKGEADVVELLGKAAGPASP